MQGKRQAPTARHKGVVDVQEALEASRDVLAVWREAAQWPDVPPLSGGVWDAWPARLAQGLAVCRREAAAVTAILTEESSG